VNDVFSDASRMVSIIREMFDALMRSDFDSDESFELLLTLLSDHQHSD